MTDRTIHKAVENEFGRTEQQEIVTWKKQDQGSHECEVWGGGPQAAEGAWAWERCTKNPGHGNFTPAGHFSLENLPAGDHGTEDVLAAVRHLSALTVRLKVAYTSKLRPHGYPFSSCGGQFITHTGSGMVKFGLDMPSHLDMASNIPRHSGDSGGCSGCTSDGHDDVERAGVVAGTGPCPCPECDISQESSSLSCLTSSHTTRPQWWEIPVLTAMHVVYDSEEAKNTVVDVFFEGEGTEERGEELQNSVTGGTGNSTCGAGTGSTKMMMHPHRGLDRGSSGGQRRVMYGRRVLGCDKTTDRCWVQCVSHDRELVAHLARHFIRLEQARAGALLHHCDGPPLCVVVSHPHGCHKTVTVGPWRDRVYAGNDSEGGGDGKDEATANRVGGSLWVRTEYRYAAPTCPGSSGGPVLILGGGAGLREEAELCKGAVLPCNSWGAAEEGRGLNGSGPWWERRNPRLDGTGSAASVG